MELSDDVRAVIASSALAHVVTLDPDGSPQVTVAWVGLDGDDVVIGTMFDQRKLQNLRRDPRVAISIEVGHRNAHGLAEYVVLHGRARVEEGGAPELLQHLAATYLGPGVKFPPMDDPPPGYTVRIAVERIGGVGAGRTAAAAPRRVGGQRVKPVRQNETATSATRSTSSSRSTR